MKISPPNYTQTPNDLSESTFERCPHDKKNPYVMISREMAQDKSISPKAKGVLLYILSLPSDWKIYHSQLQDGLGIGEDYLNSSLEELIKAGYVDRSRAKINGIFQPYKYIIREFKKCSPNGENRPGSSGPENPVIYKKDILNKQTDIVCVATPPVAASPPKIETSVVKLMADKTEKTFRLDDFITWCVQENKKYTMEEINAGWQVFIDYRTPLREAFRFLEGTIDNLRKLKKVKQLDGEVKCPKKQKKPEENSTNQDLKKKCKNSSEETSMKDTLVHPFANWKQGLELPPRYRVS